jgi:hypothetical protein
LRQKEEILGARKKDIIQIINDQDTIDRIDSASIYCSKCGKNVGWDNLGGLFYDDNEIYFVCDNLECVEDG